tara:strand:- start:1426 stop:2817 length:1392 start_codon:yes stop_codon:yes gene_type:complete
MKQLLTMLFSILIFSCSEDDIYEPVNDSTPNYQEEFPGGDGSIGLEDKRAFSQSFRNFQTSEQITFKSGNFLFENFWLEGVSNSAQNLDGLGPFFNARSCTGCHINDGRGRVPIGDENISGLLFRLHQNNSNSITGADLGDPTYGGQLQNLAISEIENLNEGKLQVTYTEISGTYPSGESYSLRNPQYSIINANYGAFNSVISPRIAPANLGLGLLEAISDEDLLKHEDEFDADEDGISGRPNYVWHIKNNKVKIGRFGWKASQPTVRQQVATAFNGDMGITTTIFPDDCPSTIDEKYCDNLIEVDDTDLEAITLYSSGLAVPFRRSFNKENTNKGQQLFSEIQCAACHVPKHITGNIGISDAFKNQTIFPYTDLLLHNMGNDLADNANDFKASGNEWRTPPLWGIGLVPIVNGHQELMHDGRARNVEEAILWHGGEAKNSKQQFKNLTKIQRQQLIDFVNSI